uniref:Uncharacterized protein n=1 Tax=Romanomermis culicivorax TaxID=13658 RepID=A0A915JZW4_ROMCU
EQSQEKAQCFRVQNFFAETFHWLKYTIAWSVGLEGLADHTQCKKHRKREMTYLIAFKHQLLFERMKIEDDRLQNIAVAEKIVSHPTYNISQYQIANTSGLNLSKIIFFGL